MVATSNNEGHSNRFKFPTSARFASIANSLQEVRSHVKLPWSKTDGMGLKSYFNKPASIMEIEKGGKREPKSGMSFPGKVCLVGDRSSCVELTGVGIRKKRLAGIKDIKAYAVGVYFSQNDIRKSAARQRSVLAKCEASSQKKEKLLDNVVKENGKNVVRLVVVFPRATGRQISKSLDDQIGHTLQKSGHYKDFEAFSQAFTGGIKFRKGTVITFSAAKDGTLTTFIDGQKRNSVRSPPVCNAITNLYLGEDTITKDLRQDALTSMTKFLPK